MAYRRTERVTRRLAARHAAIIAAAGELAAERGMAAVQIAPVARRAGIAAGTVYRYFPAKTEMVGALVAAVSDREIAAMRQAAE
ncbi:MAG: helix-turn-helix domain-containing protein, partial [Xanthobacteraceae bacterium]